jgi:hypothetical protein
VPVTPWHIEQFCVAIVAPRPIESAAERVGCQGGSTTTSLGTGPPALAPLYQLDGAPAAPQIVAHKPRSPNALLAEGSQMKPISMPTIAIASVPPTLQVNHGLRKLKTRSSLIAALR